MTCWLVFLSTVKNYLKEYSINDEQAKLILQDIEKEVGHNKELIKAVVDMEREALIKRLRRKGKEKQKKSIAYA